MKMKAATALAAAAFATNATAQGGAYGQGPARGSSSIDKFHGASVGPGKVVTKEERLRRRTARLDSGIDALDGHSDKRPSYDVEHNWAALKAKLAAKTQLFQTLDQLNRDLEQNLAPEACAIPILELQSRSRPYDVRTVVILLFFFLLVFGGIYGLTEYLLFFTRASACSVSTVYIPVTYTVTSGMPLASLASGGNLTSPTTTPTSTTTRTSTETETLTSYLTIQPQATSVDPAALSGPTSSATYVYTVDSAGITDWLHRMSPTSGASLTTLTTTVVMRPVPPTDPAAADAQSTTTQVQTITPPAYTSTVYTFASGPDLTSTSTSTHYVTYTVSRASSSVSITTTRTSFPGISNGGWNASTPAGSESESSGAATEDPMTTTTTGVSYFGSGPETTSTHTFFITTTVTPAYTTTISQTVLSPSGSAYVTTLTAVPVTITPGLSSTSSSSSIPGPVPSNASSISAAGQQTTVLGSSSTSRSLNATLSRSSSTYPLLTSGSSGILPTLSSRPSYGQMSSANATLSGMSQSQSSSSSTRAWSFTRTVSAGAVTGSQSSSASLPSSSSSGYTPLASSALSHPSASPIFSMNGTSTASPFGSSSGVSGGKGSSSAASAPSNASASSGSLSAVQTQSSSAASSSLYGYSSPSLSSPVVNTTSLSPVPPPTSPSLSSQLSTLSTSVRQSSSSSAGASSRSASTTSQTHTAKATSRQSRNGTTTSTSNLRAPFPPSSATATPTAGCGEYGNFMVNFDDLPRFLPSDQNTTDITQAPPVENPYHHLTFSDGYVYAPEPSEPYQPVSQHHLAVFLANATGKTASSFGNSVKPGEIGDGPRDPISAFWFDAYSAFFGCDNPGPGPCTLVMSAYTWNPTANAEMVTYTQNATVPPCLNMTKMDCRLHEVAFPKAFRNLTGLQVQAFTGNEQRMFFMDDLAMRWSNNSCAAGLLRQSSQ